MLHRHQRLMLGHRGYITYLPRRKQHESHRGKIMHVTVGAALLPLIPLTQTRTANQLMGSAEGLYIPKLSCYLREPITSLLAHYPSRSAHKARLRGMIQCDCSHLQDEEGVGVGGKCKCASAVRLAFKCERLRL